MKDLTMQIRTASQLAENTFNSKKTVQFFAR